MFAVAYFTDIAMVLVPNSLIAFADEAHRIVPFSGRRCRALRSASLLAANKAASVLKPTCCELPSHQPSKLFGNAGLHAARPQHRHHRWRCQQVDQRSAVLCVR